MFIAVSFAQIFAPCSRAICRWFSFVFLIFSASAIGNEVDIIVFSYDRPMQLYAFLESFQKFGLNAGEVNVIYRSSDADFSAAYVEVQTAFPAVHFLKQSDQPYADFKPLLLQTFGHGAAEYIAFAVDDIIVKDLIDFKECTTALQETGAYGFYLRLGKNIDYSYMINLKHTIPRSVKVKNNIYAWRFARGAGDWKYPNNVDMTIYKKAQIYFDLMDLSYHNPNSFEAEWAARSDLKQVGLYFEQSKIVNIPLNLVNLSTNRSMQSYSTKELLTLFNQGLKIDVSSFFQIANNSAHMEYQPQFINRTQ